MKLAFNGLKKNIPENLELKFSEKNHYANAVRKISFMLMHQNENIKSDFSKKPA